VETLTAGSATWSVSGQKLTGTTASATVTAGAQQVVIGDGAASSKNDITSPGTAGTYTINVVTRNAAGKTLDSGYCLVQIGAGKAASVTVKTLISATITDYDDTGINFGALDPGTSNQPEITQTADYGAITITIGSEVNTSIYASTKAAGDWSNGSGGTIAVGQGTFNSTNTTPGSGMTTSYQHVGAAVSHGASVQVYHWLNVPSN
jgi:hypothetical protein